MIFEDKKMKNISALITTTVLLFSPFTVYAAAPKVGADIEGGIFLHREPIEIYWTDWIGFPLMTKSAAATGQARLTVIGEGKAASFIGNLSINCTNGKYYWETAANGIENLPPSNERLINEVVPRQVIKNATRLLCR